MELESEILIWSARRLDCHFTIWAQQHEIHLISNKLKNIAEVLPYQSTPEFRNPWEITPKWGVEPKGDVVVGLDADVMVWRDDLVGEYAARCLEDQCVYGTIAYRPPFGAAMWNKLFEQHGMTDQFEYTCADGSGLASPYYINNGVVMMPATLLSKFREYHRKWLPVVNAAFPKLYYISQVANTLAVKDGNIPVKAMPKTFNLLERHNRELEDIDDTAFLHYNVTRGQVANGLNAVTSDKIRTRLAQFNKRTALI
jgi:hypothetical protein